MSRNIIETIMGGVVLLIALVFLVFVYNTSSTGTVDGYEVTARFNRIDGIATGSDVRLSGIKVGSVIGQSLDLATYEAVVVLSVQDAVKLPTDTVAKVSNDGLLGGSYLALDPGAEEEFIVDGGEITVTQDPVNIVDLLGRFVFGAVDDAAKDSAAPNP